MKYLTTLGLLAIAGAALMAFAGTASATLTAPTGTALANGSAIKATAGTTYFTSAFWDVGCTHSVLEGTVTSNGASVASGPVDTLHFSNCNYKVTVEASGTLEAKTTAKGTATMVSKNMVISLQTSLGTCKPGTGASGTHIGVLEDSHHKKGAAVLNINNSKLPIIGGSFLCGSSIGWEASFTVNTPSTLYVD